jgi:hypothetical protein
VNHKFVAGGANAFREALREQHRTQVGKLRTQLKSAKNEAERLTIQQEIARVSEIYRERKRASGRSLF